MTLLNYLRKNKTSQLSNNIDNDVYNQILHQRGSVDDIFPSDFTLEERENIDFVRRFTMTSYERLVALSRSVDYIEANKIEGDMVECGVWKGGSMMLVANRLIQLKNPERRLFLFDTFEGMTEPSINDKAFNGIEAKGLLNSKEKDGTDDIWCFSPLEDVMHNLAKTSYPFDNVYFVKGKVENTLPFEGLDKIALLRLDTDWYESTYHELVTLYDKVVLGGIIILDDYGHWEGAKKAVDDFIKGRNLKILLTRIDYTGRLAIKLEE